MRGVVEEKMQKINNHSWLSIFCIIKGVIDYTNGSSSYIFCCPYSNEVGINLKNMIAVFTLVTIEFWHTKFLSDD
jgi:hypothetical protein